jgi:hypothetical protein
MAMTLVSTTTVGSTPVSDVIFSGFAQTGKDLLVLVSGRSDLGGVAANITIRFNNISSSVYSWRRMSGDGSGSSSTTATGQNGIVIGFGVNGTGSTSNTFSNTAIYIPNYAVTQTKSVSGDAVSENNASESYQALTAGFTSDTAAITTLTVTLSGSFTQNTSVSLYIIS